MKRIGIVGVGLLGSAVASRLLSAGYAVAGYDTRPEQLSALAGQGLRAASSIADAAEGADAVFTVLPSLDSAEAVVTGKGGLVESAAKGTVVIQMSTISPDLCKRLASASESAGLPFLDAPISGTSAMVARGDCTILTGGDPEVERRCAPVLSAIAPKVVHMGPIGAAALAKLVTNMLVALNTVATAEALVLAAKGGLAPDAMLNLLSNSAASSRMLEIRGPLMVKGEYPPQMKLDLFLKDIRLMLEDGDALGAPLPLTTAAQRLYAASADSDRAGQDLAVVITELERMAGLDRS